MYVSLFLETKIWGFMLPKPVEAYENVNWLIAIKDCSSVVVEYFVVFRKQSQNLVERFTFCLFSFSEF